MSMKTERLFYENVYLREFTARVLFCGEEERGCYVILDRTAFYPETDLTLYVEQNEE